MGRLHRLHNPALHNVCCQALAAKLRSMTSAAWLLHTCRASARVRCTLYTMIALALACTSQGSRRPTVPRVADPGPHLAGTPAAWQQKKAVVFAQRLDFRSFQNLHFLACHGPRHATEDFTTPFKGAQRQGVENGKLHHSRKAQSERGRSS